MIIHFFAGIPWLLIINYFFLLFFAGNFRKILKLVQIAIRRVTHNHKEKKRFWLMMNTRQIQTAFFTSKIRMHFLPRSVVFFHFSLVKVRETKNWITKLEVQFYSNSNRRKFMDLTISENNSHRSRTNACDLAHVTEILTILNIGIGLH